MTADGATGSLERAREAPAGRAGSLPDFLIIGAMKCGTTSLYRHLGKHPEIGLSRDKETDFFLSERNFAQGFEWYAAQFSTDLVTWLPANPVPGSNAIYDVIEDSEARFVVRDKTAAGSMAERFVRLVILRPQ